MPGVRRCREYPLLMNVRSGIPNSVAALRIAHAHETSSGLY